MNAQTVTELVKNNPEALKQGQEQLQGLLARSATDLEFRKKLLADPRGTMAEFTGQPVPEKYDIRFVENQGTATIVLPDYQDPSAELSESELEAVAGGEPITLLVLGAIAAGVVVGGAAAAIYDKYN